MVEIISYSIVILFVGYIVAPFLAVALGIIYAIFGALANFIHRK